MMTGVPVLVVTFGNVNLSRAAITCLAKQTPYLYVIDNDSWDGTPDWLHGPLPQNVYATLRSERIPLAEAWNLGISYLFALFPDSSHVLVANNDILVLPNAISLLRSLDHAFVTGVGVRSDTLRAAIRDNKTAGIPTDLSSRRPHPDFSCFMIRRDTWEIVGPFDENFKGAFCEDLDYHIRMHRAGIRAECVDVPFYHESSAAVRNCPEYLKRQILQDAQRNRIYFEKKWGVPVPNSVNEGKEYYALFGPEATAPEESRSFPGLSSEAGSGTS